MKSGLQLNQTILTVMIQYFSKSSELGPLRQIPNLKQACKIIRISYPHNAIQKISPSIAKAQNTQQLDLSYNKIVNIQYIFDLRKLKVVNFSNNQIANVSKGILRLKKLEVLDLSFNLLIHMSNINTLFELYKIRKGEFKFDLEGNKVMEINKQQIDKKIQIISQQIRTKQEKLANKQQLSQLSISKSLDLHRRTLSCRHEPASKQLRKQPQIQKHVQGSLQQNKKRINNSSTSLSQYENKFQVIAASEFRGWNSHLLNVFRQQSKSVMSFIEVYKNIIKSVTIQFVNSSQANSKLQILFIQATQAQEFIKDQHSSLLESLNESPDAPMKSYKIWVQLYRELRSLTQKIRWQAWSIIQCQIRHQQIQALKIISPSKFQNTTKVRKSEQLQGLLFSKSKQGQLSSQASNGSQCSQCFIKNQQIRQLKEIVQFLTHQNSQLKQENQKTNTELGALLKEEDILGKNLRRRQEEIIIALDQKIDASVYQKVLLEQAKGIEDLIKCDRHIIKPKQYLDQTQKLGDICQTATALAKDKTVNFEKNIVSQFTENQNEKYINKLPYFNKNQYTQLSRNSKRHTQNSITSTQKKKIGNNEKGYKKTQNQKGKNMEVNSSRGKNSKDRKITDRQTSDYSCRKLPTRQMSEQSPKMIQNMPNRANTIISDFALTQSGKEQNQKHSLSRRILAEMLNKKRIQNTNISNGNNLSSNLKNQLKQKKSEENNKIKLLQVQQESQKYTPVQYHSLNLKDEQSYEDYMKYHLRNSIIETLERKGKRSSLSKQGKPLGIIQRTVKRENKQKMTEPLKYSSRVSSNSNPKKAENQIQRYELRVNSRSYTSALNKLR